MTGHCSKHQRCRGLKSLQLHQDPISTNSCQEWDRLGVVSIPRWLTAHQTSWPVPTAGAQVVLRLLRLYTDHHPPHRLQIPQRRTAHHQAGWSWTLLVVEDPRKSHPVAKASSPNRWHGSSPWSSGVNRLLVQSSHHQDHGRRSCQLDYCLYLIAESFSQRPSLSASPNQNSSKTVPTLRCEHTNRNMEKYSYLSKYATTLSRSIFVQDFPTRKARTVNALAETTLANPSSSLSITPQWGRVRALHAWKCKKSLQWSGIWAKLLLTWRKSTCFPPQKANKTLRLNVLGICQTCGEQPWLTRSRTQVLLPDRVKGQGRRTIFHSWPGRAPGVGNDSKSSLFSRSNNGPCLRTW